MSVIVIGQVLQMNLFRSSCRLQEIDLLKKKKASVCHSGLEIHTNLNQNTNHCVLYETALWTDAMMRSISFTEDEKSCPLLCNSV